MTSKTGGIVLVMGQKASGKTYLTKCLLEEDTMRFHYAGNFMLDYLLSATRCGLKHAISIIGDETNVVLQAEWCRDFKTRVNLVEAAKVLSNMGKHVYIECYPTDFEWLEWLFIHTPNRKAGEEARI